MENYEMKTRITSKTGRRTEFTRFFLRDFQRLMPQRRNTPHKKKQESQSKVRWWSESWPPVGCVAIPSSEIAAYHCKDERVRRRSVVARWFLAEIQLRYRPLFARPAHQFFFLLLVREGDVLLIPFFVRRQTARSIVGCRGRELSNHWL